MISRKDYMIWKWLLNPTSTVMKHRIRILVSPQLWKLLVVRVRKESVFCVVCTLIFNLQSADSIDISEDVQPNATMQTTVTGQGQPKRVGRWTLAQLRQTDGGFESRLRHIFLWNSCQDKHYMLLQVLFRPRPVGTRETLRSWWPTSDRPETPTPGWRPTTSRFVDCALYPGV